MLQSIHKDASIGSVQSPPPKKTQNILVNPHAMWQVCSFLHSNPILLDKSIRAYKNRATGVNVVSVGSPSRIRIVRRISFGITTRPRSSIRLTIPVAFMFRTSFLAAAGASRIPVRALRKGFLHSRKGGSRPLCPHGRPIAAWWGTWLLFEKATGIIPCAHILSGMVPNSAYPAV